MEIHKDVKITRFPKLQRTEPVILDHSAVALYKECPQKYFYRIVLGRTPNENEQFFTFGSCYHRFREVLERTYQELIAKGTTKQESIKESLTPAINAALEMWVKKGGVDPKPEDKFSFQTKERLIKTCIHSFKHWEKEKLLGLIEVIAIEQPFNVMLPNGEFTSGRFDQVIRWHGKLWGRDFKTTSSDPKYYERSVKPNDQFVRYTWAQSQLQGEPVMGQIIEVMYNDKDKGRGNAKTPTGPEIHQFTVTFTPKEIEMWLNEEMWWRNIIALSRENDLYPKNERACKFCKYHAVCKAPSDMGAEVQLTNYYRFHPWDNTKVD